MKIAMPIVQNQLCMHFGHCEVFAFFDVDEETKQIKDKTLITPPPHEPGILPPWIKQQGADLVIAGGMGSRAQNLFNAAGVKVITGAKGNSPEDIINNFLNENLETGPNACDH